MPAAPLDGNVFCAFKHSVLQIAKKITVAKNYFMMYKF